MRIIYMSDYKITKYSFDKAKELNLTIKVSKNPLKKLDVYTNNGVFLGNIGDSRYNDFPHYCIIYNKKYAETRKLLYKNRHKKNSDVKYSKQWLALNLLW